MQRSFILLLASVLFASAAHAEGGASGRPAATASSATYGAVSYDAKTRNWAYAVHFSDPAAATAMASKLCGPTCLVDGPFRQCGAAATDGAAVGFGEGADATAAENAARGKCGSGACTTAVSACNAAVAGEGHGYRMETRHARNFGAIAFDERSGAFGVAWDYGNLRDAANAAKAICGGNCRIYLAQAGGCGALAQGSGASGAGEGIDAPAAERMALAKCRNAACKPVAWFCNSDTP